MKSFENRTPIVEEEPEYNEYLEDLWKEYRFAGKPPVMGSVAERRLKEKCQVYSQYVIEAKGKATYKDDDRRKLHNEIAVMTAGTQRSSMTIEDARHIANFAMAYLHGITVDELETGDYDDKFNVK